MPSYFLNIIHDQLKKSGIRIVDDPSQEMSFLHQIDIIEYMVFECAGALPLLKAMPLRCQCSGWDKGIYIAFDPSNPDDDEQETALDPKIHENFQKTLQLIQGKFPGSIEAPVFAMNGNRWRYTIKIPRDDIAVAILSSSLFMASGSLTHLDKETLFHLQNKLSEYRIADQKLNTLVDLLINRLANYLAEPQKQEEKYEISATAVAGHEVFTSPKAYPKPILDLILGYLSFFDIVSCLNRKENDETKGFEEALDAQTMGFIRLLMRYLYRDNPVVAFFPKCSLALQLNVLRKPNLSNFEIEWIHSNLRFVVHMRHLLADYLHSEKVDADNRIICMFLNCDLHLDWSKPLKKFERQSGYRTSKQMVVKKAITSFDQPSWFLLIEILLLNRQQLTCKVWEKYAAHLPVIIQTFEQIVKAMGTGDELWTHPGMDDDSPVAYSHQQIVAAKVDEDWAKMILLQQVEALDTTQGACRFYTTNRNLFYYQPRSRLNVFSSASLAEDVFSRLNVKMEELEKPKKESLPDDALEQKKDYICQLLKMERDHLQKTTVLFFDPIQFNRAIWEVKSANTEAELANTIKFSDLEFLRQIIMEAPSVGDEYRLTWSNGSLSS
jgi:hypothetical protein